MAYDWTQDANCVGAWLLDESTGNAEDATANNNDITLSGVSYSQSAQFGTGISFDGTNDKGSVALNLSSYNIITLVFWADFDAFENNDDLAFEFTANYNTNNGGFLVDPDAGAPVSGYFQLGMRSTSSTYGRFDRPTDAWHHYTVIFNISTNPNTITIYVDAVEKTFTYSAQSTATANFANSTLNVMCRNGSSLFGVGVLDEIAIFSDALTESEITDIYNNGLKQASATTYKRRTLVGVGR
jgi:hypothetical protein